MVSFFFSDLRQILAKIKISRHSCAQQKPIWEQRIFREENCAVCNLIKAPIMFQYAMLLCPTAIYSLSKLHFLLWLPKPVKVWAHMILLLKEENAMCLSLAGPSCQGAQNGRWGFVFKLNSDAFFFNLSILTLFLYISRKSLMADWLLEHHRQMCYFINISIHMYK